MLLRALLHTHGPGACGNEGEEDPALLPCQCREDHRDEEKLSSTDGGSPSHGSDRGPSNSSSALLPTVFKKQSSIVFPRKTFFDELVDS